MQILNFSRIAENSKIVGNLEFVGESYIAGYISGDLRVAAPGTLIIEPTGVVEGNINCDGIQILGTVLGNIYSTGHVIIKASGRVKGQVESKSLQVMPGAQLELEIDIQ